MKLNLICMMVLFYSPLGFAHSITQISAASEYVCALDRSGVRCKAAEPWFDPWLSTVPTFSNPKRVFATDMEVVVVDDNGLEAWAKQSQTQYHISDDRPFYYNDVDFAVCTLGTGGVKCSADFGGAGFGYITKVPNFNNVKMMVSRGWNACAVADDDVSCWGEKFPAWEGRQLFDKPTLKHPFFVALGRDNACAIDEIGAHCWGVADGILNLPLLKNPKQIAIGETCACALHDDGVKCWGDQQPNEAEVKSFKNPTMLSSVGGNLCVLDDVGVWCWDTDHLKTPLRLMLQ